VGDDIFCDISFLEGEQRISLFPCLCALGNASAAFTDDVGAL